MRMPRLTYANVTSTIALIVALGGGTAIAVQQINAEKVDGVSAGRISFVRDFAPDIVPYKTFFSQGGLKLQARCYLQSGSYLDERAKSTRNNAEIHIAVIGLNQGTPDEEYVFDNNFDRGDTLEIPETIQGNATEVILTYSTPKASHLSAVFQRDVSGGTLGNKKGCLIGGTALHTP
jgi:hypothetical protein